MYVYDAQVASGPHKITVSLFHVASSVCAVLAFYWFPPLYVITRALSVQGIYIYPLYYIDIPFGLYAVLFIRSPHYV